MELGTLRPYRHSGKFGLGALLVLPLCAVVLGWPLGFAYGYLIKWIPFVYLNFFIVLGYGAALGAASDFLLKKCHVRNVVVAFVLTALVGVAALYFQWNGHVNALFDEASWLCPPGDLWGAMQFLYEHGSWSIGRHSTGNVTGVILAGVWVCEAAGIVATILYFGTDSARTVPYCEKSRVWLDESKKYDTLAFFSDAAQQAALAAGDIAPVIEARPREEGAMQFARLVLKHSPRCEEFFTLKVENVTLTTNKKGEVEEKTRELTKDLILPREMRELIERFASLTPGSPAAESAAATASAASLPPSV